MFWVWVFAIIGILTVACTVGAMVLVTAVAVKQKFVERKNYVDPIAAENFAVARAKLILKD